MLKNYFKVGLRNILRSKGYAFINVIGLAVGLACVILIAAYVFDDLSFDNFHPNNKNIYRVALERHFPDRQRTFARTPLPMAAALYTDYPEVIKSTRLFKNQQDTRLRREEHDFYENSYLLADSSFFTIFGVDLLKGEEQTVLAKPNSIVLTEATATKYFGKEEALGKMLIVGDTSQFVVTGICKDVSSKSHVEFDFLLSMISYQQLYNGNFWGSYNAYTYVVLEEGTNKDVLEGKLPETIEQYVGPQLESVLGITYEEYFNAGNLHNYFLQPISSIHLHSNFQGEIKPNASLSNINLFAIVSIFILTIACINFVNLSTAQAGKRAKEVGVRKAIGSSKSSLVGQFLIESILLSTTATIVAIILAITLLPNFNDIASKNISLIGISPLLAGVVLLIIALAVGILAGLYPAFYLSSIEPTKILKGSHEVSSSRPRLRNILVVFQFSISIFLSIATLVVYRQMEYMKNRDLGFEKEQILIIDRATSLGLSLSSFRNELLEYPGIEAVSSSNQLPGRQMGGGTFEAAGMSNAERFLHASMRVDYGFYDTYGIELLEGRLFSDDFATDDSLAVVINEATVRMVGWEDPIGMFIQPVFGPQLEVIGVVKDFNFNSLHEVISPLVISGFDIEELQANLPDIISIKINKSSDIIDVVSSIEKGWQKRVGDQPFEYSFLDQEFDAHYRQEEQFGQVFLLFSLLVVFIAIIGVIGLSTFMAAQRRKEIGVRKVLGASTTSIWLLLSREFMILVGITNLLIWPISYYGVIEWLNGYPYSIEVGFWPFIIVGAASFIIVLFTVALQSYKAASANPVTSIRNE